MFPSLSQTPENHLSGLAHCRTFQPVTVLKRDAFSETVLGHRSDAPDARLVMRRLDGLAQPGRGIGRILARREARALQAVSGIEGAPQLLGLDSSGLLRGWLEGTPLQLARPAHPEFYRDALRLLRQIHRTGVTHNDLAKPQNWLMTPEGGAAVIDFQIASVSRRRGRMFRLRAYEDLRHLLKQKRRFAPGLMTNRDWAIVNRRSLPSRVWRNTAKPAYNFVTRRLLNWSDGEGAGQRLAQDAPAIRERLLAHPQIRAVQICGYPRAAGGQGLYGFVETGLETAALRRLVPERQIELLQPVPELPRGEDGAVRCDLLELVALNRLDEAQQMHCAAPPATGALEPILRDRLNLTDRF